MDINKLYELGETKEDSLLDAQIKYHRLKFNKLREIKFLKNNYSKVKDIANKYLNKEEDHQSVYLEEIDALKLCLKSIKRIKSIDAELKIIEQLLQSKEDEYSNVYKNIYELLKK